MLIFFIILEVTVAPLDGQWGSWGPWDECSTPCGGGYRIRRRRCDNPAPQNEGQDCQGCHLDYEQCNTHACPDAKRLSSWTPWLATNATNSAAGYTERRFRFACRAPVTDAVLIKVAQAKEEERFCHSDGSCIRTGDKPCELYFLVTEHHTGWVYRSGTLF